MCIGTLVSHSFDWSSHASFDWSSPASLPPAGLSRGPSPLSLSAQETWPVAAALTEYINAYFKGREQNRSALPLPFIKHSYLPFTELGHLPFTKHSNLPFTKH